MTILTGARRKQMPPSDFALPGKRFPINDKTHARMAISGATRAKRAGNISPSQAAKVKDSAKGKMKGC